MFINNHEYFLLKIKNRELTPYDIFNKSPFSVFSNNWAEIEKRKKQEEKFLYETGYVPNCNEICYKCNKKNINITEQQIRGSDEPPSFIKKCLTYQCQNKWIC